MNQENIEITLLKNIANGNIETYDIKNTKEDRVLDVAIVHILPEPIHKITIEGKIEL